MSTAENFTLAIGKFCRKAGNNSSLVVRKVSLELFSRVILRTPVDTGRARGNWYPSIGAPSREISGRADKTGGAPISESDQITSRAKAGDVIYLTNNLPYINALEYGSSKQAPQGMVRLTLREFRQVVDGAARSVP